MAKKEYPTWNTPFYQDETGGGCLISPLYSFGMSTRQTDITGRDVSLSFRYPRAFFHQLTPDPFTFKLHGNLSVSEINYPILVFIYSILGTYRSI